MEESKIRELVNNHPDDEKVVLEDLISNLIKMQIPLGELEIHNYKNSVKDALKIIAEQERLTTLIKRRLRNEVRPEVMKWHNEKPKKKINMHPNSLNNLKYKQK